jgi:hypothetical protein
MRHLTFTSLAVVAIIFVSQNAYGQVFQQTSNEFIGLHRTTPVIGDYNNDGYPDIYYGGASWLINDIVPDWSAAGILYTNHGNGEFTVERALLSDSTGFVDHGLPPTMWGKECFVDVNNDGYSDFFVQGKSDCDFQMGDEPDYHYSLLYINGGSENNYQYSIVANSGILNACDQHPYDNYAHSSYDFGDYDNDGYMDLIMLGERNYMEGADQKWERYVKLFHNNGDNTFTEKKVFNPIEYSSNPRPDNLFDIDTLTFEATPKMIAKPMASGAVRFGDLNNDGYLDIVCTGYVDGTNGGGSFYIYKNLGNGTFQEVDIAAQPFVGCYESELTIADINNDGYLDILSTGTPNEGDKRSDIYLNNGSESGEFSFTLSSADGGSGLKGVSCGVNDIVDLNADGLPDIILSGWNSTDSWTTYVFTQNADNTFTQQDAGLTWFSCGHTIGDIYQRNTVDVFGMNTTYTDDWHLNCNLFKNQYEDNTVPQAPANVTTAQNGDTLTISWDPATDDQTATEGLYYNVYVKDLSTGKISMILPANIETGRLQAYRDMQTLVHAPENPHFSIKIDAGTSYEVGVQTVDPSYATSKFTTISLTTGIQTITGPSSQAKVVTLSNGIIVNSAMTQEVSIFTPSGEEIATGTTGKLIPIGYQGVLIVKVGTQAIKVIK